MEDTEAQKKEADAVEPLEDMAPEDDVTGGGPHVKVFSGRDSAGLGTDAQKKEGDIV
ncbi:MAG: hypothetical protein ABIR71_13560 [Chthoniobacterales bacterium]